MKSCRLVIIILAGSNFRPRTLIIEHRWVSGTKLTSVTRNFYSTSVIFIQNNKNYMLEVYLLQVFGSKSLGRVLWLVQDVFGRCLSRLSDV